MESGTMDQKQLYHQSSNSEMNYYTITSSAQANQAHYQQSRYSKISVLPNSTFCHHQQYHQNTTSYYAYHLSMANEQWRQMSNNHYNYKNHATTSHREPRQISQYGRHHTTRTNVSVDDFNSVLRKGSSFLEDTSDEESDEESCTNTEDEEPKTTTKKKQAQGKKKQSCNVRNKRKRSTRQPQVKTVRRVTRSQSKREGLLSC
jgi:hypothetical protein